LENVDHPLDGFPDPRGQCGERHDDEDSRQRQHHGVLGHRLTLLPLTGHADELERVEKIHVVSPPLEQSNGPALDATGCGRLEVQSTSAMESNVRAVAAILATK